LAGGWVEEKKKRGESKQMMSFREFVFMQHHREEHEETIITSYTPH
jgi:hypothetical protein